MCIIRVNLVKATLHYYINYLSWNERFLQFCIANKTIDNTLSNMSNKLHVFPFKSVIFHFISFLKNLLKVVQF